MRRTITSAWTLALAVTAFAGSLSAQGLREAAARHAETFLAARFGDKAAFTAGEPGSLNAAILLDESEKGTSLCLEKLSASADEAPSGTVLDEYALHQGRKKVAENALAKEGRTLWAVPYSTAGDSGTLLLCLEGTEPCLHYFEKTQKPESTSHK